MPLCQIHGAVVQAFSIGLLHRYGRAFRCRCCARNFSFHLVFLPTASFLSAEKFGVEVIVDWVLAIGPRVVNLFPHPSLACCN
jgi:hypothetical protein